MRAKNAVILLSMLVLLSGLVQNLEALSIEDVSMTGEGVTINLTFPTEAHPLDSITHNLTITANTGLTMDFTISISAPVDSSWQEVKRQTLTGYDIPENGNFTSNLEFILPREANGTLYCFLNVSTNVNNKYLLTTLYTTHVSELTFSEMQSLYNEMLANYTTLQADYETLLNEYNGLLANYSGLSADYAALQSERDELFSKYNSQVAAYASLLDDFNTLSEDHKTLNFNYQSKLNEYNALQANFNSLNSSYYSLQANYTSLQAVYKELNETCTELEAELNDLKQDIMDSNNALNTDRIVMFIFLVAVACLIAFIIYIKRKEREPYVVIRKKTVAVEPDEKS